jgi:uncharacterized protein YjgD (DUF1641 family)
METVDMQARLDSIQNQLSYITQEMEAQRRRRIELEELKDDLNRITGEVFHAAVTELEEVAQHVDSNDILFLLKKLLRNTRHLTRLIDRMEGMADFARDVSPITKELFQEIMTTLDTMDRKHYFEFFSEFIKIADTVVTSFSAEDVRQLRENVTLMLSTVKNITQPEMLATVNNALGFYKKMDIAVDDKIGYWKIIKELRDPETRRGIAYMIRFLKNMAAVNDTLQTQTNHTLIGGA